MGKYLILKMVVGFADVLVICSMNSMHLCLPFSAVSRLNCDNSFIISGSIELVAIVTWALFAIVAAIRCTVCIAIIAIVAMLSFSLERLLVPLLC